MTFSWKAILFLMILVVFSIQITAVNAQLFPPPLKQFRSGISIGKIQCNQGLSLMIRHGNGEPACVTQATAIKLYNRGWGTLRGLQAFFPYGNIRNSSSLGNHTLPASFMPCDAPFPQSNTGVAILLLPTNSIGKICVRYYNPDNTPYPVGINIFDANNINQNATGITTWNDLGNNPTISKGYSIVTYWIRTENQSGLYGIGFYCGNWNPLAVGYDIKSNMTSSNFPFLRETMPCPHQPYQINIDSTTGIGIKNIPYP